jgi:hypothetical protein
VDAVDGGPDHIANCFYDGSGVGHCHLSVGSDVGRRRCSRLGVQATFYYFPFFQLLLRSLFSSSSEKCFLTKSIISTKQMEFKAVFFFRTTAFHSIIFIAPQTILLVSFFFSKWVKVERCFTSVSS